VVALAEAALSRRCCVSTRRHGNVVFAVVTCGVLLWWNVTLPSRIGQATARLSTGRHISRSLCTSEGRS